MTEDEALSRSNSKPADDEMPSYTYGPLTGSQFRLLTIHPGQNTDGDTLKASLTIHDLRGRKPGWEAISYHWGDSDFTNAVLIDGCAIYVNDSAYSALWHLRLAHRERTVWLDQVCINQGDEEERYQQVPLMGDIFRHAQLVVIYLRDAWPGAEILFQYFDILRDMPKVWHLGWWYGRRQVPEDSPLRRLTEVKTTLPAKTLARLEALGDDVDTITEAFNTLRSSPYFSRTWVIQEAGVSKKCVIQCSQHTATWECLMYLEAAIRQDAFKTYSFDAMTGSRVMNSVTLLRDWYIGRRPSLQSWMAEMGYNPRVLTLYYMWRVTRSTIEHVWKRDRTALVSITRHFRHQQSTDGQDKVFGFLGLAHSGQAKEFLAVCRSDPETKRDLCQISNAMYSFAVWQIESTRTLDVLMGTCYKGTAHADLPYWVADWSCRPSDCDTEWVFPFRTHPHQAGTQYPAEPEILTGSRALIVRGVIFDVVEEVVDTFVRLKEWQDPLHETWQKWREFALKSVDDEVDDPYGDEAGRYEAYWRTLIYDVDGAGKRASADEFAPLFKRWSKGQEDYSSYDGISGRIVWPTHGLFRTKRGYLGNGCADVKAGDLVCVLHGGRLPFVLRYERDVEGMPAKSVFNDWSPTYRQLKGYYLIGGDAYVHGICEGQAWDLAQRHNIPTQEFALI